MTSKQMHARKFYEGQLVQVVVRGLPHARILWFMDKRVGSVMLDREIQGLAMWNVDTLRPVRKKRDVYNYIWYWRPSWMRPIDRKGARCRVVVRGKKNSVLVEFEDGFQVVTSRYAVRKAK